MPWHLSCNPSILLADEPTTALDVTVQAQILDLMRELQAEFHSSIMLITHNLSLQMADQIAVMYWARLSNMDLHGQSSQSATSIHDWVSVDPVLAQNGKG
ncbi:MAG: hypothetical protein R2867_46845 [Caldilineaceae bacterium]